MCLGSLNTELELLAAVPTVVPVSAWAFLELRASPEWKLKYTKWGIPKAFPDSHKSLVEISLIPTALSPHVSKDRIFKATINLKGKVIRY